MSSIGFPAASAATNIGETTTLSRVLKRRTGVLAFVIAADIALAYAVSDRGALEAVLGAVIGLEALAMCIFRTRSALLIFVALWGAVHVLLSNGEAGVTGGASASVSQLIGVTVTLGFGIAVLTLHSRRGSEPVPLALRAFAIFACLYAVAELLTPERASGLSDFIKLVGGLVLGFAGYYFIRDERRLLSLARAVEIAALLVAGAALVQFIAGSSLGLPSTVETGGLSRVSSVVGSPNGTADFLLVCAGFILLRYTLRRDKHGARFDLGMLIIVSLGIIVTFTRADIAALVVMFLIWAALRQVRSISATALRVRLAIVVIGVAVAVVGAVGTGPLLSRLEGRRGASTQADILNGRAEVWSTDLHKLESANLGTLLIGSGAHTSYTTVYITQAEADVIYPPHDLFLWLAIETGLVGLAVYVTALFSLCRSFLRTARGSRFTPSGQVAAVAFATTIAFVIDGMFHNTQLSADSDWYFMLFVGAALGMLQTRSRVAAKS